MLHFRQRRVVLLENVGSAILAADEPLKAPLFVSSIEPPRLLCLLAPLNPQGSFVC
jgi:hypothetical protein